MNGWFVTGTDTGVGKTQVSAALLLRLNAEGERALGMKPVASGCTWTVKGQVSADAECLRLASAEPLPYRDVNPYAFAPAIAPHIAAEQSATEIDPGHIVAVARRLQQQATLLVVEGVGGWSVPIAPGATMKDVAVQLGLPVILVVGLRLGCINHALLTYESIARSGLPLAGWIANQIDPAMDRIAENIESLAHWIPAPCLASVPFIKDMQPAMIAPLLDIATLKR